MKKIVFLLFSMCLVWMAHSVEASNEQVDVTYETVNGETVLVIDIKGAVPIRIERGNAHDYYTVTQSYFEDGHYVFFGYAELEETQSHFDGYALVVDEEGGIVYEQIIDEYHLEEVKAAKVTEEGLYLLVDQSMDRRPDSSDFKSSLVLKVTDDYEVLYESDVPLRRIKLKDSALFMSEAYSGDYEWGLINGNLIETGDILGLEEGGQYIETLTFFTLCKDSSIEGDKIDEVHSESYPGHYQFTCEDETINFTVHPLIEGIELFEKKEAPIAVTVSEGRVWLNDDLYVSESLIDEPGYHTLRIEGANGYELRRSFTLTSNLEGVENDQVYKEEKTVYFSGTASLNGNPIKSGRTISKNNEYELIINGQGDYQETVNFTLEIEEEPTQFNQLRLEMGIVAGAFIFTGGGIFIYKKRK